MFSCALLQHVAAIVSSEGETVQGGETPNTWAKGLNGSQKQDRVSILLIHKVLQKQRAERNKFLVLRNHPKSEGVQRKICKSALPVSPLMQVLGHSDLVKHLKK